MIKCKKCGGEASEEWDIETVNNGNRDIGNPLEMLIYYSRCKSCSREFFPTEQILINDANMKTLKNVAKTIQNNIKNGVDDAETYYIGVMDAYETLLEEHGEEGFNMGLSMLKSLVLNEPPVYHGINVYETLAEIAVKNVLDVIADKSLQLENN